MRISINRLGSSHGRGGLEGDRPSSSLDDHFLSEVRISASAPTASRRSRKFPPRYCLSAANQLTDYVYDETGLLREILSKYRGEEKVDRKIAYIAPIERSAKLRESSERRDYGHEKTMDRQGKARDSA